MRAGRHLATLVVVLVVGLNGELRRCARRGEVEPVAGGHRPRTVGHVGRHDDGEGALPVGPEQPWLVSAWNRGLRLTRLLSRIDHRKARILNRQKGGSRRSRHGQ
jgi:hypothetical protein